MIFDLRLTDMSVIYTVTFITCYTYSVGKFSSTAQETLKKKIFNFSKSEMCILLSNITVFRIMKKVTTRLLTTRNTWI